MIQSSRFSWKHWLILSSQGRFDNKAMLEAHVAAGPCWPQERTITRLYEEVKLETPDTALDTTAAPAELLRIKQERVEAGACQDPLEGKRERMDGGPADFSSPQSVPAVPPGVYQASGPSLTPETSTYRPPSVNSQFSQSVHSVPNWRDILNNVRQQPNTNPDLFICPSYSNYTPARSPGVKPEPGPVRQRSRVSSPLPSVPPVQPGLFNCPATPASGLPVQPVQPGSPPSNQPIPSPQFSPLRPKSVLRPPPPSEPLPSPGGLFARREDRLRSSEVEVEVLELVRTVSGLNCSRQLCDWSDPHVENCKRLKIQARCERGDCKPGDLHSLALKSRAGGALTPCPELKLTISGGREHQIQMIPLELSQSREDPRVGQQDYARNRQHTAVKTLQTQRRGAKWDIISIISTWSNIRKIRVVPGDNPNLQL